MDQQDVYVEKVSVCPGFRRSRAARDGTAPRCALQGERWVPLQVIHDTIRVKGEAPRAVRLEFSRHGPLVGEDSARDRAFALRFVGSEPGTAGYLAQLTVDRATDWNGFRRGAARWKLPTENLVYADVDGNIGWVAAGLMPIRSWSGLLPVPGNGKYEWNGFLPFEDLPTSYNPASGFVTTSNQNILPPGYTKPLNYDWAEPFRHDRLVEVLRDSSRFTRQDFERLQHDELSLPARTLVPLLKAAGGNDPARAGRSVAFRVALDSLSAWDYVMRRDQAAPLIYEAWLGMLQSRVLEVRFGAAAHRPDVYLETAVLIKTLSAPDSLYGRNPRVARDSILLGALAQAVAQVAKTAGADPAAWRWGAMHQAFFKHPLAAAFDLAPVSRGGDGNTVNATAGPGYRQTAGASYRIVVDFADFDNSTATSVPGQSGQPGSEYYGNLLPLWGEGKYFPLLYSRAAVERGTTHLLWLKP
jgi:penicillin amidase